MLIVFLRNKNFHQYYLKNNNFGKVRMNINALLIILRNTVVLKSKFVFFSIERSISLGIPLSQNKPLKHIFQIIGI